MEYIFVGIMALACCLSVDAGEQGLARGLPTIHVGLSSDLFSDVRHEDACAAVKIWADSLFSITGSDAYTNPVIYSDPESMRQGLFAGETDLIAVYPEELMQVDDLLDLDDVLLISVNGEIEWEYMLLVRKDSGFDNLVSLQGKTITYTEEPRRCLSGIWLETQLLMRAKKPWERFFSESLSEVKTSTAILKVFFGQSDACLVSRKGYELLVELNPQVGRELQVVMHSPKFVRAVMCLRKSCDPAHRRQLKNAVLNVAENPRSQQVQRLFGVDDVVAGSRKDLDRVYQLVELHSKLLAELERVE